MNPNQQTFPASTDTIIKLMHALIDKYGVTSIDSIGTILQLNKGGKTLSQQSPEEIRQNLTQLTNILKDPEIKEALMEFIEELKPFFKQAMQVVLDVVLSSSEYAINDILNFLSHDTPAAPLFSIPKFMENTGDFANQLINSSSKSLKVFQNFNAMLTHAKNNLLTKIQTKLEEAQNIQPQMQQSFQMQQGGAKTLKKYKKEQKMIMNRINHSINKFLKSKQNKMKTRKRKTRHYQHKTK